MAMRLMSVETAERVARFLIPAALVLAIVAAVREDWFVVATAVLIILGQAANLWGIARRRKGSADSAAEGRPPTWP